MPETIIKVENLSKQYRLGKVGTGTLSHDIKRWWHLVRGKEDPFLKIGEKNIRDSKGESEYVWALKDINFEVKRGEVLGIIGKNGAGKSTLLKILSRITTPTTGEFKVNGRIASLLEVGTGFHPELTGRENIFLNGAILGMSKAEIKSKFDEIVAFSGVERYIDTPVKRYSSGMYVRLAFAVAAHLEPEILIVDEVLAVGDAEFQKKCLGKMKDISGEGRTILFVTHNLVAIRELSTRGIYLKNGGVEDAGTIHKVIDTYLNENVQMLNDGNIPKGASTYNSGDASFLKFYVKNEQNETRDTFYYQEKIKVEMILETKKNLSDLIIDMSIGTLESKATYTSTFDIDKKFINLYAGIHKIEILMDPKLLPGNYTFHIGVHEMSKAGHTLDFVERIGIFNVLPITNDGSPKYPLGMNFGNVRIDGNWTIVKHN